MANDPAVIGNIGLMGPINLPKKRPTIPYFLKKILPEERNSGYLLKGHILFKEFLKLKPIKKLAISEIRLEKYAIKTTSKILIEVAAKPEITANKTTPGTTIPINAKDSINEAPIIPNAIHSGFCSNHIIISLNSNILGL